MSTVASIEGEYRNIVQTRHVNASDFFHNLENKAKVIAEEEAEKMAKSMLYALRFRQNLKGESQGASPKWNPQQLKFSHRNPRSKKSFLKWEIDKRSNGEYWLSNNAEADNGYNYLKPILTGKGWSSKVANSPHIGNPHKSRLVRKGNLIFSNQLPNGINPWLVRKREEMEAKILKRLSKELL